MINKIIPKECIIIGGGNSISEGIKLGLKNKIKNKFVVTCNYAYKHFDNTFTTYIDRSFYKTNDITKNPDIYEELKKLPLIIGVKDEKKENNDYIHDNTILVKKDYINYNREKSLEKGFFTGALTGIFTLSLVSFLMNYEGIIYLLGFDWTKTNSTHYYNDIKHRGINYSGYYDNHNANLFFKHFIEPKLKIYNVSLISKINIFEKIDYNKMFSLLNNQKYNQEEIRKEIINLLSKRET